MSSPIEVSLTERDITVLKFALVKTVEHLKHKRDEHGDYQQACQQQVLDNFFIEAEIINNQLEQALFDLEARA